MVTKKEINSNVTGLNLKQRFDSLGLSTDNVTARIEGVTKSVGERGTWFTMIVSILVNNVFHNFTAKLNAGSGNAEHVKNTEDYFAVFQAGDYQLNNLNLRVKGETWEAEDGKSKGNYEQSYINIPFVSDMIYMGKEAVLNQKKQESQYSKLALLEMVEVE